MSNTFDYLFRSDKACFMRFFEDFIDKHLENRQKITKNKAF